MPTELVFTVDASCLVKLFLEEEGAPAYRDLHYHLLENGAKLAGPVLLEYEVGNRAAREYAEPERSAQQQMDALEGILLEPTLPRLVQKHARGQTYYDAAYAAHAEQHEAILLTFDHDQATLAQTHQATVFGPRTFTLLHDDAFATWLAHKVGARTHPQLREALQAQGWQGDPGTLLAIDGTFVTGGVGAPARRMLYDQFAAYTQTSGSPRTNS